MYRENATTLFEAIAGELAAFDFVAVEPQQQRYLHRKTWNTNRGVVFARLANESELVSRVPILVQEARGPLRHSWWAQLGLQIVFELEGALPPKSVLAPLVDPINHQDILVQSVFAVDVTTGDHTEARTWGQVVTGKFQDAIARGIAAYRAGRRT